MTKLYTLLSVAVVLGMSACSSSKNATQSSDDMYYSSGSAKGNTSGGSGQYVTAAPNDQYVQMKVQDPERWSYFDDYNAYDAYAAPAYGYGAYSGYGGFGYPAYGFGYGAGFGPSFGIGLGFGDPYLLWNNYFIWNSWYNPYFYNPYYGGGAMVVSHSPTAIYSNLRPFNTLSYKNGLAHNGVTGASRNGVYRPGMTSTTAYNSHLASNTRSTNNVYRPANNNNGFRSFNSQPTRSYSPSLGGGGVRSGGFSGRH
jgi:hypothetical protein